MPRRPLSRDRILAAAIAMADRDGFDQVTLRRLAAELGVHVTSLYNHVPTRDAVVEGMIDALVAEAGLPMRVKNWEDWIRKMARAMRGVVDRHPGAASAFFRQPARGPVAAEVLETALTAFEAVGLSPGEAYQAIRSTFLAILGLMAEELARRARPEARSEFRTVSAARFPRVHNLASMPDSTDQWKFMIDALITGIAARTTGVPFRRGERRRRISGAKADRP